MRGVQLRTGNWCIKCGAQDFEPARAACTNPLWHEPNRLAAAARQRYEPKKLEDAS